MPERKTIEDAEMDRLLSRQDEILPSSGFVASVMDSVRREAAAPPPIPFPWKRALPVLTLAVVALALVMIFGVSIFEHLGQSSSPRDFTALSRPTLPDLLQGPIGTGLGWTALALVAAFMSVKLSMRLAGGKT
jgi:hypothetical protein